MKTYLFIFISILLHVTNGTARSIVDSPEFESAFENLVHNFAPPDDNFFADANEKLDSAVYRTGASQNIVREAIRRWMNDKSKREYWPQIFWMAQRNQIDPNEVAYWLRYNLEEIVLSPSEHFLKHVQLHLKSNYGIEDDWQRILEIANNLPAEQAARAEKLREMARSIKSGQEWSRQLREEQRVFEAKISAENAQAEQTLASPWVSKTKPKSPANIKPSPAPPAVIPEVATISTTSWLPWLLLIVGALVGVGLLMRKQGR